jgi:hypothetical protein
MLTKSLVGYVVAVGFAIALYFAIARTVERRFLVTAHAPPPGRWMALQWLSTGFLCTQWLVQDLATSSCTCRAGRALAGCCSPSR